MYLIPTVNYKYLKEKDINDIIDSMKHLEIYHNFLLTPTEAYRLLMFPGKIVPSSFHVTYWVNLMVEYPELYKTRGMLFPNTTTIIVLDNNEDRDYISRFDGRFDLPVGMFGPAALYINTLASELSEPVYITAVNKTDNFERDREILGTELRYLRRYALKKKKGKVGSFRFNESTYLTVLILSDDIRKFSALFAELFYEDYIFIVGRSPYEFEKFDYTIYENWKKSILPKLYGLRRKANRYPYLVRSTWKDYKRKFPHKFKGRFQRVYKK